jgi:phage terminase large subunit-like protein
VAIDPAVTANAESDMTGIVVAGIDLNGTSYILEDATDRFTPEGWATKAVELYNKYLADRIVAERNQGGEMVRHTLQTVDETIPIRLVHASRGKYARAEPVSALYERHKVKHLKGLDKLEDQLVAWEPLGSIGSPDRLDALVWAVTDLALKGIAKPTLNLSYADAKGLLTKDY